MVLKPAREHATNNSQTYFVTSDTWERRALFRSEPWARLLFKMLLSHRGEAYLLHEFVLMPDHFHFLITPLISLERAIQLIKGGFSYRVKKELGSNAEIWQRGFSDHRIRDWEDFEKHVHYIHLNPVKKGICKKPGEYKYSSAYPGWKLDPIPQWLKPLANEASDGTTKVVPFQNDQEACGMAETVPFQSNIAQAGTAEVVPFQDNPTQPGANKTVSAQSMSRKFSEQMEDKKSMPRRNDIQKILVIGSGPIVIGQSAEFDYSGTQACKALKQEGYEVVLVNSNPATIMTDPELADRTYIEPLTHEYVEEIIRIEAEMLTGPQGLKPKTMRRRSGTAEAVPFKQEAGKICSAADRRRPNGSQSRRRSGRHRRSRTLQRRAHRRQA